MSAVKLEGVGEGMFAELAEDETDGCPGFGSSLAFMSCLTHLVF